MTTDPAPRTVIGLLLLLGVSSRAAELGVEGDIELAHEAQGGESAGEITFDEVGLTLEGEWWIAEAGIKYRSEGDRGLAVEDAALRLGGVERRPWFAEIGRTVLPFAESDSPFGEDPLVTVIGEIYDEAVIPGFANEAVEVSLGAFRGEPADGSDVGFVASAKVYFADGVRLDASWCSGIGESVELRELRQDFLDESGSGDSGSPVETVGGFGGALALEVEPWSAVVQYVSALSSFPAGQLTSDALSPAAWSTETTVRPAERWSISGRVEGSRDFPENPALQGGVAASFEASEHAAVSAEYLRGSFHGDVPDRDLVGLKLALSY
ncbi:MAG: LbtU family siderophore porin [Candidatus Eiseniibacteriota bacterium]